MMSRITLFFVFIACFALNEMKAQIGSRYTETEIADQTAYMAAQVDMWMDRYDLAVPKLLKIYKQDLKNGIIAFDLAKAYDNLEDYPNAEKYGAIAAREESDNIWILNFYAQLMVKMEKYEEAGLTFQKLMNKDSDDLSHVENYVKALIKNGHEKEALKAAENWEKSNFVLENLVRLKFDIYNEKKDYKNAEKELKKLVDFDPFNIRYLNNLGHFYIARGKKNEARPLYDRVIELDPNNSTANTAIFKIVSENEKDGPYLRTLLPLIERTDIDPEMKVAELIPFVTQLSKKNDPELTSSLLELTQSLVLIHPEEAKTHAIRADVLQLAGQNSNAIKEYEKTLAIDKKVYEVWSQLLYLLNNEGRYEELKKWSYKALDYFPNRSLNYYFYGVAQNEMGAFSDAADLLEEGLMIAAKDQVARSNILSELARAALNSNKIDQAETYVAESLRLSQDKNPFALEVKGDLLALNGETAEAQKYWAKAKKMGSNRKSLTKKLNQ